MAVPISSSTNTMSRRMDSNQIRVKRFFSVLRITVMKLDMYIQKLRHEVKVFETY